jgi:hypothetical protein
LVFDHGERELNTWGVGAIGSIWEKGNSLRPSYPKRVQEGYPGSLSEFDSREKWNALRHKFPKEIYTVDHRKRA